MATSDEIATLLAEQVFSKNRAPATTKGKRMLVEMKMGVRGAGG
jgi:hypothetical protein